MSDDQLVALMVTIMQVGERINGELMDIERAVTRDGSWFSWAPDSVADSIVRARNILSAVAEARK